MKKNVIIFLLLGIFCSFSVFAADPMQGLAVVTIKSKRLAMVENVGLKVSSEQVQFFAINEVGGIPFWVSYQNGKLLFSTPDQQYLSKGKKVKPFLSLPLTQEEFFAILNYKMPSEYTQQIGDDEEFWLHPRKKKLIIHFEDFKTVKGQKWPHSVSLNYKKYKFQIQWQSIKM